MESDTHECYTCTVSDRFGAMGLISVLSATIENDQAVIDTWLMSCRAFSRRIEFAFFGHFADMLRKRGVKTLVGCYSPTPRNEIVRDIYATMGFKSLGTNREDVFEWILKGTDKITLPAIGHIQCRGEASFDQKNNS